MPPPKNDAAIERRKAIVQRFAPRIVPLLPPEIGEALQNAALAEDREEIARITKAARKSYPEYFRDESDGKFPAKGANK